MRRVILLVCGALVALSGVFAQAPPGSKPPGQPESGWQGGPVALRPEPPITQSQMFERQADVLMARKQYREGAEIYSKALSLDPKNAVLANKIGIAFHQMLQLGMARRFYERAVRLNKNYSEAINNLGTIYYAQKHYRKAIHFYQKALKIKSDSASIYSNLGTGFFAIKKYDEAFAAYRQALALDPEVFEHRSSYGVLLQERSVEDRARFHFFLARTYASAGNFDRSLEYLRKALEEGFKDKKKIYEDPVFAELIKTQPFAELMANPPPALPQ